MIKVQTAKQCNSFLEIEVVWIKNNILGCKILRKDLNWYQFLAYTKWSFTKETYEETA